MKQTSFTSVVLFLVINTLPNLWAGPATADDLLIADFEGETYDDWKTTGEAFGRGPARGTLPGQMHVDGFLGKGLVNSFFQGDGTVGTLTSPEFKIERRFISFLIGGGTDKEKTCINLIVDGKAVRNATGPNDAPGGTEALLATSWDVSPFAGKMAHIQIVDQATGGWGHINVDHILQTDKKTPELLSDVERSFAISKRYLNLPIKNGAPRRKVTVLVDGGQEVVNDIELADGDPDWWAFMDVSAWSGRTVTVRVDRLREDSQALQSISQADSIVDSDSFYQEPLRAQFHFSSRRGWNNDPNGLVFFNGEYHLFYQHNPYGWSWGNMHWGHATSPDLIHWQEHGDKLAPDEFGPMFSGSAVVDWKNTSGLGTIEQPPLVLLYTAAGNPTVQGLAFSTDGRNFVKYHSNPVMPQITGGNRDPKVIWHEPSGRWVMVLYVELPEKKHTVHFFTSPNLKEWTLASVFEGGIDADKFLYECPDLFELPVDGDATNTKWVLTAADGQYAVGTFDGTTFTAEATRLPGHLGRGFYAAQTFSDIPKADGRRIQIGWLQTPTVGMPFNQAMTVPLELQLVTTPEGPRLTTFPVKELTDLRTSSKTWESVTLTPNSKNPLAEPGTELLEIRAQFRPGKTTVASFQIRGGLVQYDAAKQELDVIGHRVPVALQDGKLDLIILCDRTCFEIFAGNGLVYVPLPFQPKTDDVSLSLKVSGEPADFELLEVHALKSAWTTPR